MAAKYQSLYRTAMEVASKRIALLTDIELVELMGALLQAEAALCGVRLDQVFVNTEEKAGDAGCDGWTGKPATSNVWLGSVPTCWQLKAGDNGEPKKLKGEISKEIARQTLSDGGRFVAVCSGSNSGPAGAARRLKVLLEEAQELKLPTDKISVLTSETLATWCNTHPGIAARYSALPDNLWTLSKWETSKEHETPFLASPKQLEEITSRRTELEIGSGTVDHLHIQGPPGVGKTRLALELCRNAKWRNEVIYVRQAADGRLIELVDGAVANGGYLVVVADEAQYEQLRPLRDALDGAKKRVRIITIGHSSSPDPSRIPAIEVKPLDLQAVKAVVAQWYEGMPAEHVDFVARFSAGYMRLARLAAFAVSTNPGVDAKALLERAEIKGFLDQMLGGGDRRALYVVAVLSKVGWYDELEAEGKVVSEHFGLDWGAVRASVTAFHRDYVIAPRGGRYRYISPTPLANYLALEAWSTYATELKSLPDVLAEKLGTTQSVDAYFERMKSISSNPQARAFAREELRFFFQLEHFHDLSDARRWAALAGADPGLAVRQIYNALKGSAIRARLQIKDSSRREIVWALTKLAWNAATFHDATLSLALLAEAESESFANNASGEFVARFQIFLGGTSVPYLERLDVIDELLQMKRQRLIQISIRALAKVADRSSSRVNVEPISNAVPEIEWHPTGREYLTSIEAGISKLIEVVKTAPESVEDEVILAAQQIAGFLDEPLLIGHVAEFFRKVKERFPKRREVLRQLIADVLFEPNLGEEDEAGKTTNELTALHEEFEDPSLSGRLRQVVGHTWSRQPAEHELNEIAERLVASPEAIQQEWAWLTSGDAHAAWQLGQAIARHDVDKSRLSQLSRLGTTGRDLRIVCGYIWQLRQTEGDGWYEAWFRGLAEASIKPVGLLVSVARTCGITPSVSAILTAVLEDAEPSPGLIDQLRYASWIETIDIGQLLPLVRAISKISSATAVGIIERRLEKTESETDFWRGLAISLVKEKRLIRSTRMAGHEWSLLATRYARESPVNIARAIFKAQLIPTKRHWFIVHSNASKVLGACMTADPRGVWSVLRPILESNEAQRFVIGFPREVFELGPFAEIEAWIGEAPAERGSLVAKLVRKDVSNDETWAARIIGRFGDVEEVADAFYVEMITGSFSGSSSAHWLELSEQLDGVGKSTKRPKLRRWARDTSEHLAVMSIRDRQREEEDNL